MKFVYEYKTSSNERRSGVVAASSRDDVYQKLKKEGIRPFRVDLAPGLINRLQSLGKRWLAIGVLFVLAIGATTLWLMAERKIADGGVLPQTSERHQIYGDPSILAEMERTAFASVFEHPGERILAFFAQPGRPVSLPTELSDKVSDLKASLARVISIDLEEPREVVELKRIVNGMKAEMRDYLAESSEGAYLRELNARQEEESMIYTRVANELKESDDASLWESRNKSLRELGLRTIARPKRR